MNRPILIPLAIIGVALLAAPVYRWVDEQGVIHYSDEAPSDQVGVEEVELLPPPPEEEVIRARARLEGMLADLEAGREAREAESALRQLEQELEEVERVQRLRRCQRARQNLHALGIQRPVYTIDERGEYVYLDDEDRAAAMQAMQEEIAANCD